MNAARMLLLLSAMLVASPVAAQSVDWRAEIGADYVQLIDGKMVYEDFNTCTDAVAGTEYVVRYYAEAPVNAGISRDFFVGQAATNHATLFILLMAVRSSADLVTFVNGFSCVPSPDSVDTADYEVRIVMTAEGLASEFVDHGENRSSPSYLTWEEAFSP